MPNAPCAISEKFFPPQSSVASSNSKQSNLWVEGDLYRQKQCEQENGINKAAVTGILSGVDDISINGTNKNSAPRRSELVSSC